MEYRVWSNTDYKIPFETNNRRKAEAVWRKVRPRPNAGSLYAASFSIRCDKCGAWKDIIAEIDTCGC